MYLERIIPMNKNNKRKDPTENVSNLLAIYTERADRLREAEQQRINELMLANATHSTQLRDAEAKRIDAIRAVDINAVSVANERATAQAAVLANQVAASAETLRALVASAASTQATQLTQLTTQLTDRIALLEKAQYESKGSGSGMRDMYAWLIAGAMSLITIGTLIYSVVRH